MRKHKFAIAAFLGLAALTTGAASYANTPDDNDEMMRVATGHDRIGRNINAPGALIVYVTTFPFAENPVTDAPLLTVMFDVPNVLVSTPEVASA